MGVILGLFLKYVLLYMPAVLILKANYVAVPRRFAWAAISLLPGLALPFVVKFTFSLLGGDLQAATVVLLAVNFLVFLGAWVVYWVFQAANKPNAPNNSFKADGVPPRP
jgi:hypothetical protein